MSELADEFLNAKRVCTESGELSPRSFRDYHAGCAQIVEHFGKERLVSDCRPENFTAYRQKISKTRGLHSIGWAVTLTRMLFGFDYDSELIEKPIRFGQQFNKPTKKSMRLDRAKKQEKHGLKMFQAEEIRQLADGASVQVKAMILLAVNGGGSGTRISQTFHSLPFMGTGWCSLGSKPGLNAAFHCGLKRVRQFRRPSQHAHDQKQMKTISRFSSSDGQPIKRQERLAN
jgi:hypothetical protein